MFNLPERIEDLDLLIKSDSRIEKFSVTFADASGGIDQVFPLPGLTYSAAEVKEALVAADRLLASLGRQIVRVSFARFDG